MVIIFTYHRVLPTAGNAAVSVETFEKQLRFLLENDYRIIDTENFAELMVNKNIDENKYVMLTFDDGWADNFFFATPILEKYKVRAVMAVTTGFVNPFAGVRKPQDFVIKDSKQACWDAIYRKDFSSFLTWGELKILRESGLWDIQAHGNTHLACYRDFSVIKGFFPKSQHWIMEYAAGEPPFNGLPKAKFHSILSMPRTSLASEFKEQLKNISDDRQRIVFCKKYPEPVKILESQADFIKRVHDDLSLCKDLLETRLFIKVSSVFWPWGDYSEASIKAALSVGYKLLFTMNRNIVTSKTSQTEIPRLPAPQTFAKFRKRIFLFTNPVVRFFQRK